MEISSVNNTHFFDSFWKTSFYKEGKATSFWKSFWKLVLVVLLVSIAYSIYFYVSFGKNIPSYLYTYSQQALNGYPSDLVLTIKDGVLSKNVEGTLQLYPIPEIDTKTSMEERSLPTYFVTIDDGRTGSLESYKEANSLVLLAKDGMVTQRDGELKIVSYNDIAETTKESTFSKKDIMYWVGVINKYSYLIPYGIIASIIIFSVLFLPFWYLLINLLYGLIIMLLSKWIIGKKISFDESYILTLYALPPSFIAHNVLSNIPYIERVINASPFFMMLFIVLFLGFMFRRQSAKGSALAA